jgi:ABC-type multidrug transport system permease subunit
MRHLLFVGHQDVRRLLRSRVAYVWLFAMPLLFIYFMGFANRGPGRPSNPRPAVLLDNPDPGFVGAVFLEELGTQGLRTLPPDQAGDAERGLRIPADFTGRVLAGETAKVGFFDVETTLSGPGAMVELRLLRAVIAMNSHLVAAATRAGAGQALDETLLRQAQAVPPTVVLDARFAGRKPMPTGFSFSLPGNIVMYVMMNLLVFGGASLSAERSRGILRRLAALPIGRGQLVGGKIYGLLLLGLVQVGVFLVAGRLLFDVPLGANLPAVLLVLLVYSWVAASLGVFLASVIRAEDKVIGVCVMLSLLLAALGGCWWPLEIAPTALQRIAHLLPSGWAMEALHQLISFGSGFEAVVKPLGILAAFGLVAHLLAARCFRL